MNKQIITSHILSWPIDFARKIVRSLREWRRRNRIYRLSGTLSGYFMKGRLSKEYIEGSYELSVCNLIQKIIKPTWFCLDVGAQIGYFSLLFGRLVGEGGQVVAFEAHHANAAMVKKNLLLNGLENRVKVVNMAVTDGNEPSVKLYAGRKRSAAEWNILGRDVAGNETVFECEVQATSLDHYFPGGSKIDFIKMDIEGAEGMAVPGMLRILRESRPICFLEFHGEAWDICIPIFLREGYGIYDVKNSVWLEREKLSERRYHVLLVPEEKKGWID